MPTDQKLAQGYFVQPVIFTGVANDNQLCREEIFGPVTCVIRFKDYEDAIRQANDSEYGLAATIWTRDLKTALDADATARGRPRPGQPEPGGAGQHVLWRRQAVGPGQGGLARIDAGAFHAEEDHHPQSRLSGGTGQRAMRRFLRLRFLLLLPVLALVGGFIWLRSSLPLEDGRLVLAGLSGEVRISRDEHGIPSITAASDRDAAFALGFVHAQDRLFQMDTMRRYGAGRLSEWFGAAALRADRFMRTLGLYRAAEQQYALLSARAARGARRLCRRRQRLSDAAPRRAAARIPVAARDARAVATGRHAWSGASSWICSLPRNFRSELLHARLAQHLSPEELADPLSRTIRMTRR